MTFGRILVRRVSDNIQDYIDISEVFYNTDNRVLGVGDGSTNPPKMLGESNVQTVTNKTIDNRDNNLVDVPLVGTIILFPTNQSAKNKLGNKWLICDGRLVNRTEYSELFNTISTTFGAGNGITTFRIPSIPFNVESNMEYHIKAIP